MDCAELSRVLDSIIEGILSPERVAHSRRVAELSALLCAREGLDPERGRVAGLAHDLCKELPKKTQAALGVSYKGAEPGSVLMADKVVHGPAAAVLMARDYALADEDVLEAIAVHTVGKPGMSDLATILYCADKLEPGRERLDSAHRERCLSLPLREMLLAVVEGVVEWMRVQGKAVAPETLILYSTLVREADPL